MSSPPPSPIVAPLEAPAARSGGCLRVALIGCGGVALLCVLAFVGLVLYGRKNPGVFLDFAMSQIESNYGPDVTEEDKKDLRAAVTDFKQALRENRIRENRNTGWQRSFGYRSSHDKLTHEDVRDLIKTFRESIVPVPGPASSPAAVATPS